MSDIHNNVARNARKSWLDVDFDMIEQFVKIHEIFRIWWSKAVKKGEKLRELLAKLDFVVDKGRDG